MTRTLPDLLQTLGGFADFGLLTAQGELTFPAGNTADSTERSLVDRLKTHSRDLLRAYLRQPDMPGWRLALIHRPQDPASRNPADLCFETDVIHQLYPAGNRNSGSLTAFQQKCRHQDLAHGIALLLSQYPDIAPEIPLYCPVLFDRHTMLAHYCDAPGQAAAPELANTPVIEVLNFSAPLALNQRASAEILALRARLQRSLPMQDGRDAPTFDILDDLPQPLYAETAGDAQYHGVDKRTDRDVFLPERALQQLHVSQHHEPVERWLELPHRAVSAARLQEFVHFRDLDPARLSVLAARSFVYTAAPGSPLLDLGMADPWNMYLLEGTVLLTAADGAGYTVEGGGAKASHPVAFLKPRKYTVTTLTKVSFLWIHDTLLHVLRASRTPPTDPAPVPGGESDADPGTGPADPRLHR